MVLFETYQLAKANKNELCELKNFFGQTIRYHCSHCVN